MTAAIIVLAAAMLAACGANILSARRISTLVDRLAEEMHGAAAAKLDLAILQTQMERATFELDLRGRALAAATTRNTELEAALAESMARERPNADLAVDDVAARLQRRRAAHAAADSGGALRADASGAVHGDRPTGAAAPPVGVPSGLPDV